MKTIDFNTLLEKMNSDHESFILLNAMKPAPSRTQQIPNSMNFYVIDDDGQVIGKDVEIVVYCADSACNQSINLYYILEKLGYKNVARYAGGLRDWYGHGMELEEIRTTNAA